MSIRSIFFLIILILLSIVNKAQVSNEGREDAFWKLRKIIEINFKFIDTNQASKIRSFAFIRLLRDSNQLQIETASFNDAFKLSFKALTDSISKKFVWRSDYPKQILIPISLSIEGEDNTTFNDSYINAFESVFRDSIPNYNLNFLLTKPLALINWEITKHDKRHISVNKAIELKK